MTHQASHRGLFSSAHTTVGDGIVVHLLNLSSDRVSLSLESRTVALIDGEHVVVAPTIHLDREDCSLARKSGLRTRAITHFVNPRLEVEPFNGRHCIVLLLLSDNIVVFSRRVDTKHHGLS